MAQQTAVEWLFEQYKKHGILFSQDEEQAKEMEREQIITAHGLKYYDLNEEVITGEQYYNKTYGTRLQNETNSTPNKIPPPPTPPPSRFLKEGKEPPKRNQLK